eukprot:32847_1
MNIQPILPSLLTFINSAWNQYTTNNDQTFMNTTKENFIIVCPNDLAQIIMHLTAFPLALSMIIADYTFPRLTTINPRINPNILKSTLQSKQGFQIELRCLFPPYNFRKTDWRIPHRLITIKEGKYYHQITRLAISFNYYEHEKNLKLLIYVPTRWDKSWLFDISEDSMRKYINHGVDIKCVFQWIQNKGYKLMVTSKQLDFVKNDRECIAKVKHFGEWNFENAKIVNGKKSNSQRPTCNVHISPI